MVRVLVAGVLVLSGLVAIALPASAEDGGQYYRGRNGIVSEQDASTLQR